MGQVMRIGIVGTGMGLALACLSLSVSAESLKVVEKEVKEFHETSMKLADESAAVIIRDFECRNRLCEKKDENRITKVVLNGDAVRIIMTDTTYVANPYECQEVVSSLKDDLKRSYTVKFRPVYKTIAPPAFVGVSETDVNAVLKLETGNVGVTVRCRPSTKNARELVVSYKIDKKPSMGNQ